MSEEHPGEKLRKLCLSYPGATEDTPWGEYAYKVNKKVFVFMSLGDDRLSLSMKLPKSRDSALRLKGAAPTGYGLGKHGWVSLRFDAGTDIPTADLERWIDESYRTIAPKKSVKELDARLS